MTASSWPRLGSAIWCLLLVSAPAAVAQQASWGSPLTSIVRPYKTEVVAPVRLESSERLAALLRAGRLYLSLQDAIALALENNLAIEIERYGPRIAEAELRGAKAGGSPNAPLSSGTAIPGLDPVITTQFDWNHRTQPLTNSFVTGTNALVSTTRTSNLGIQKSFLTGTTVSFGWNNNTLEQNAARNDFNPYTAASFGVTITQRLLQGFGLAVNSRNIRIASNNVTVSDLAFRRQVIDTTTAVIRVYWDLVGLNQEVDVAKQTWELAAKLRDENKERVELGSIAEIEVLRTQAEVARALEELTISETRVLEQENVLKALITGADFPSLALAEARIVPIDRLRMPAMETVQPLQDLAALALERRPELAQLRLQIENAETSLKGTRSALLPSLDLIVSAQNNALAGQVNTLPVPSFQSGTAGSGTRDPSQVNPFFLGGYGTALSQLFARNFPDYGIGLQLTIPLRNRAARADMARDQLLLRQQEISRLETQNQVRLELRNALVALRQARARHEAAVEASRYAQETLEGERAKYDLGASTVFFVLQAQRDLARARLGESAAQAAYGIARADLDRATGGTLTANNIEIEQAKKGRISWPPGIPAAEQELKR